ncbi:hypothetical protein AAFN88_20050 [Pelagibius sp. CAU 1746]|uniref:hypothetical protein n=1 Tax=Pelagibius sp. CAU 1746 TaxID=3140370 RepID=UPI00325B7C8F
MSESEDPHQSTLIDRLASTTLRLRNLFYVNLVLAVAVMFLVFQDRTFVSEKIGPAVETLQPVLEVDRYLKANRARFTSYHAELRQAAAQIRDVSRAIAQAEAMSAKMAPDLQQQMEDLAKQTLSDDEIDFLDDFGSLHENSEGALRLLEGYFELDLKTADYYHLTGFAVYLLFADAWTQALEKSRDIVIKADSIHPSELITPEARGRDLRRLSLERYNDRVLEDSVLTNLLDDLPKARDFLRAVMVIEAFCGANNLGNCSIEDISNWQAARAAEASSKLSAPGIEVQVTRELLVPASPLILLVAFHLYIVQFRRRQELRRELAPLLPAARLDLLDESWVLNGLLLNLTGLAGLWRRLQSTVLALFVFAAQAAPLAAILVAGYYTFNQLLLGAFIEEELAWTLSDLKEAAATIGVDALPEPPVAQSLLLEYLWIAVAAFCTIVVIGSLYQLLRDQAFEILAAWKRRAEG